MLTGFDVSLEVVQDRLPTAALLFDRVRCLRVKSFAYRNAIVTRDELDQQHPVSEGTLDQLMLHELRIRAGEIKSHMLPSLASMRDEKAPPTRKSTADLVVCQSSDAAFHCLMSPGVFQARHTCSIGAAIVSFNCDLLTHRVSFYLALRAISLIVGINFVLVIRSRPTVRPSTLNAAKTLLIARLPKRVTATTATVGFANLISRDDTPSHSFPHSGPLKRHEV